MLMAQNAPAATPKESPLLNLALNILLPSLILMKMSGEDRLGPFYAFVVALAFPLGYGIYSFIKDKKVNFISVLGFVSILITGVVGLLKLDAHWIAVKEAAVPFIIGLAVIISLYTPFPIIKKILLNEQLVDLPKIKEALSSKGTEKAFDSLLIKATYMLAGSFMLSATLNYALAKYLLKSPVGTEAFNEELGQMTALSLPVIAVPSTLVMLLTLWYLVRGIKTLTGLELKDIMPQMA
jgi:hypothetical protein